MNDINDLINKINCIIEAKPAAAIGIDGRCGSRAAGKPVVIGIDGRCGAGKTTLAGHLASLYNAGIIHMDDFFLPPELRTPGRLAEPGGNVHYERFRGEVIDGVLRGEPFSYRVFDCKSMGYNGCRRISPQPLVIIEGSYSLREDFRFLYDIKVFADISKEKQRERIIKRSGEEAFKAFKEKWIPMEERYFKEMKVKSCCDIAIES
ncbi:MAG: uridine kinase [Oscillospiraceae bacterium]|nr:uridine kinase [Oscillospiraceae bacterium]